jgi:hypothetical protein
MYWYGRWCFAKCCHHFYVWMKNLKANCFFLPRNIHLYENSLCYISIANADYCWLGLCSAFLRYGMHISTLYWQVSVTVCFLSKDEFFCTNVIIEGKFIYFIYFPFVYLRTKALCVVHFSVIWRSIICHINTSKIQILRKPFRINQSTIIKGKGYVIK